MNSRWSRFKHGLTRNAQIGIVVIIIIIIAAGGYTAIVFTTSSKSSISKPTPPTNGTFTDNYQLGTPDALDPSFAFFTTDGSLMTSVYQELYEYNTTQFSGTTGVAGGPGGMIPVLATSVAYNGTTQYVYTMRSGVTFSNGDPENAYSAWFSFERTIFINAPSFTAASNFAPLTYEFNGTSQLQAAWGLLNAIHSQNPAVPTATQAGNYGSSANENTQVAAIENILDNFNSANSTIQAIMAYPDQAYVAPNSSTFIANTILPYSQFTQDAGVWWGAIVDPAFVDSTCGLVTASTCSTSGTGATYSGANVNNTYNTYFASSGGPGTGPYEIKSVTGYGTPATNVVLNLNPKYWATSSAPAMIQPGHIATIVIPFGIAESAAENNFGTNKAQIAAVSSASLIGAVWAAYNYKAAVGNSFQKLIYNPGSYPGFLALETNALLAPTNNNNIRLALANLENYTAIFDATALYNSTSFASTSVGPLTTGYSQYKASYTNDYTYTPNLGKALSYLKAGLNQTNEFTVLTNGSTISGNPNNKPASGGTLLPSLSFWYISPLNIGTQTQISLLEAEFSQLGISLDVRGVTESYYSSVSTTPATSPNIADIGWIPDWPDPVFQLLYQADTPVSHLGGWVNSTIANDILVNCRSNFATPGCNYGTAHDNTSTYGRYGIVFNGNAVQVQAGIDALYALNYNYASYMWQPNLDQFFFVQPYVQGLYWNGFFGYAYNTITYSSS